jgi:hypothetical protein
LRWGFPALSSGILIITVWRAGKARPRRASEDGTHGFTE